MGRQVIKQPDGRLCIFSNNSDTIIARDMTPADVIEYFSSRARRIAETDAARIVDRVLANAAREVYYQFAMTYEEAEATHRQQGRP